MMRAARRTTAAPPPRAPRPEMASPAPLAPRLPDCAALHGALVACVASEERLRAVLLAWAPELRLGLGAFAPRSASGAAALSSRSYRFEGRADAHALDADTAAAAAALAPRLALHEVQTALLLRREYPGATAAALRALPGAPEEALRRCTRRLLRERKALLCVLRDVLLCAAAEAEAGAVRPRYRYAAEAADALEQMQVRGACAAPCAAGGRCAVAARAAARRL